MDKSFETVRKVTLYDYLDLIAKKTAWLFRVSCEMGAILGGGSRAQIDNLAQYGYDLGMAFQIQDDLLDFVADESKLGKKVGSDFKMEKKTYITLKYDSIWQQNPDLAKRFPEHVASFSSLPDFQNALQEMGVVNQVQNELNQYFEKSLNSLKKVLPVDNDHPLYRITHLVHDRQY